MKPISDASSSTSPHRGSKSCEAFRSFIVTSFNWRDLPSSVRSQRLLRATMILLTFHKTEPMDLKSKWTPKWERHAEEAIDGDGLECQQDDGYHKHHQLPGLGEDAKRDNQCRCPRRCVRCTK